MKDALYRRCRAQTTREFNFWSLMLDTPSNERSRAMKRHVRNRQRRGRILALKIVAKNRQAGGRAAHMLPSQKEARGYANMIGHHLSGRGHTPDHIWVDGKHFELRDGKYVETDWVEL